MSTDPDKGTGCPIESDKCVTTEVKDCGDNISELNNVCKEKKKEHRSVRFPGDDLMVTEYFEPANPWNDVPTTTKSQLAAEYLEACRRHDTPCIDTVLQQIRDLPDNSIGGALRAPRLTLAECSLAGPAPADALEAVMRKVQFRRLEIDHATIDDEGAEAIFDMIEYYESANVLSIAGPRQFGIRGWQAASRMIKKSAELTELEVTDAPLEASHAPVLARSLRAHTCTLRALCLQRVSLCGEPLLCLVIALKSNSSIRELRLGDNRLSVSDAAQLASLLRYNARIQLLDLSNNQIQDAGVAHLAEALAEQAAQSPPSAAASPLDPNRCTVGGHEARGLAFLVLWNNQLTRNCAPYLNKALRSSWSLCVLNVGRNALCGDAVRALCRAPALLSLGLQAARLGPDAATALADLVRADTKLQRLDLRENRLGGAGLSAILAALKENTTLTQIDLDEPPTPDSTNLQAEDKESAYIRRVTREIRALCRRNDTTRHDDDVHPVHRKISLTCHTACLLRQGLGTGEEERRGRLRSPAPSPAASPAPSPAPSPAGSPVPAPTHTSRFMVTRVTPERDSSTDSSGSTSSSSSTPTRLPYCPPSRFKVVQVMEPPQIQVHPASNQPRKSPSRFSVTRNYDSVYNPTPTPPNSPAQPNIYAQLQNEVVTQLKQEALTQPKTEVVAQTKNDSTQTKNEVVTQIRHDTNIKCEALSNEVLVKSEISENLDAHNKNEVHTQVKSEITAVKNDPVSDLVQKPVKKVITAQVRSQAMKQSKLEQLNQVQEPTVLVKSEVTVQSDSKPKETVKIEPSAQSTEEITVKNNVTTQIKHESNKNEANAHTKDVSTIQVKNEPVSTVKNVVTTQVHKEPISVKNESQIQVKNEGSQVTQKVESTCQTSATENKSTSIDSKNSSDKTELEAQLKGFPVEFLSHIGPTQRNDTVTQFNTEADARLRKIESAKTHTDEAKSSNIESRNEAVTQSTELVTQHRNIPIEPTSLVNIDEKPIKSLTVESSSQKDETITQTKTDLVTQSKNIPVDSTSKSIIDIKDTLNTNVEHAIQVKNSSNTQPQTELVTQHKSIPVEPNIERNCGIKDTEVDLVLQDNKPTAKLESELPMTTKNLPVEHKQDKTILVEPVIQNKNIADTSIKTELVTHTQNVPVEPKDKAKAQPVSLKQIINTDTQLKIELPTQSESSCTSKPSIESKTQLRDLLETSSKIKTSPSHSILPKTSIATIEESPECEEIELSDSDVNTQLQSTSESKTKTNVECTGIVEHKNTSIEPLKTELLSNIEKTETDKTKVESSTDSSTQLEKQTAVRDTADVNVIDLSIKSILVQSDLKYSDVVKNDKNTVKPKVCDKQTDKAMDNIVAITEDLGNIIKEMKVLVKNKNSLDETVPADSVLLKKNKSESSLDSPDLEVSRLMEKRVECVFDSNSSLEISGSSMESLNEQNKTVQELDRRKSGTILSAEGSMESTSDVTPVNSGNFLNLSLSSNESVSPIFGKTKLIHDSLSSLEASVSSLDSAKHDRVMVTSADSGIEYSLQHPSEMRDDNSSNEGTLTNNSSLRESVRKPEAYQIGDTIASSPKRASSLLDVPALKNKGLDRMRKISWVAPSSSFHIPRPEEKEAKPSHLEKLLSLFQHPSSIFSRSLTSDDEKKSASSTPPRKDSSLTSSFWSWGSTIEKDREEDSSEATDSTLSERVQVSFVDESFSRKLDSKTPSTDTDNTLSEFQSFPTQESESVEERVTKSTEDIIVQNLDLSVISNTKRVDSEKKDDLVREGQENIEKEVARPRSFAAVLKSSGSENSLDKQNSPDSGQPVDKLPSKVIRGIKENISPENTLTSSMTNTKALAVELERQVKTNVSETIKNEPKVDEVKTQDLAPIATIEETDDDNPLQLAYIDDVKVDSDITIDTRVAEIDKGAKIEGIDLGKDALSYLIYENRDFEVGAGSVVKTTAQQGSLAEELKQAEIKEIIDLSPELVVEENVQDKVFTAKEMVGLRTSPIVPERAKLKKSNSLEELSQLSDETSPKTKTIVFKVPESTPRDIPERRSKLRTRSGSSPKSLPESLNKPCPLTKMESILSKKKKKVSSLGKIARDSLLALNMSEEEIAEFRRSYKLTSVESLKSLESVSESGNSVDSRCRACLRHSQESLMSLDSISEDCRCTEECEKPGKSAR